MGGMGIGGWLVIARPADACKMSKTIVQLTADQKDKLRDLTPAAGGMREQMQSLRDLPQESQAKMAELMRENQQKTKKQLAEVLKPDQLKRLDQIALQATEAVEVV